MTTTTRPEPWHRVVRLKDELRSGELTLAEFAAGLHEITLGQGTRPIKADQRSRIKETPVDAEALLPDGPYDLWQASDEGRYANELVRAFARNPRLPKFLKANVVVDTIMQGIDRGLFVAELARPDGSRRTWWREVPPREVMGDDQLRVVLPDKAELAELPEQLLAPGAGALPGLWDDESVTLADAVSYFRGGHVVTVSRDGYDEVETIPRCAEQIVRDAIRAAVSQGLIWLANGPTSVWYEPVPEDALTRAAILRARPDRIPVTSLVEDVLPGAWQEGSTNGVDLTRSLSQMRGEALPWGLVRESILAGVDSRWLQVKDGDAVDLHTAYRDAGRLTLERPSIDAGPESPPTPAFQPTAELEGHRIQDLADLVPELIEASAGYQLKFRVQMVLNDAPEDVRGRAEQLINIRLKSEPDG